MDTTKRYGVTIKGRVQGVGFRYAAREAARSLGIRGFVKNLSGNCVYIEAEGETEALETFLAWCRKGPSRARVEDLIHIEMPVAGTEEFDIRF